jgi:hypothetical protein
MSWLKYLLDSHLPVGEALMGDETVRFVSEFGRAWEARLAREEALLVGNGLPVPKCETFRCRIEDSRVRWTLPVIVFPPHLTYDAFRQAKNAAKEPEPLRREWMSYVVAGVPESEMSEAKQLLELSGIIELLHAAPGRWFNRDPYEMYRDIQDNWNNDWFQSNLYDSQAIQVCIKKLTNRPSAKLKYYSTETPLGEPAPLFEVKGYTALDMERFQERLEFANRMAPVATHKSPFQYLKLSPPAEGKRQSSFASDEILFSLEVPAPAIARERVLLKLLPPATTSAAANKEFFNALHSVTHPITFEFVDNSETAYFQLCCAKADLALVERQLDLHFRDCARIAIEENPATSRRLRSLTLQLNFMFDDGPLLTSFSRDPLTQFVSCMTPLSGEIGALQVTFWPFPRTVLTSMPKESWPGIIWKQYDKKHPVWMVTVNVMASSESLRDQFKSSFVSQYVAPRTKWTVLNRSPRFNWRWAETDMLLSSTELAAFAHLPFTDLGCDRLETANMKQKLPPELFTNAGVTVGGSEARGIKKQVVIPQVIRDRHVYVVGKTGAGKSTLIFNAALQDILQNEGVAVIDPHGDLVASGEQGLLHYIPEHRIKDVIYLNAADKDHPIGMNLLAASNDEELELLATNLQTTFRRLSDSWGERMDNLLRFSLHTLVQIPGSTFFDLKRLLQDAAFRKTVVARLTDLRLTDFWQNDFAGYRDSIQPIISRLGKFMLSPLYGMLSQPTSKLDLFDVIQSKKILLVNLGGIGEEDAQLLGSLLISQLQLAVMRRSKLSTANRHPYYLYVDEFQSFTSRAFAKILSEARKYQLCLTLAHQFISQLGESERDAIFGNVGTMIMFGVGDKDAQALRHQLGKYEPLDLVNLLKYHALCRPEQPSDTFLFATNAPPPKPQSFADQIVARSRATYATSVVVTQAPPLRDEAQPPIATSRSEAMPTSRSERQIEEQCSVALPHISTPPSSTVALSDVGSRVVPLPTLGRGGQQHKYLQQLIKRLAEERGYHVVIEDPVLAGIGSVDVSLARNGNRIACEISVSSTSHYELKNIHKCLAAGFDQVIVLSSEKKALTKIKKLATEEFDAATRQRVFFFLPEEFVAFLDQTAKAHVSGESNVRGYKVKVKYKQPGSGEQAAQRAAIAKVILQAMRRLKDEN